MAASVLVMVEKLHKNGIVFRDLKLENIMVESHTGKLKLVDFGFSKLIEDSRTFTKCGSPAYMAPEVIMISEGSKTGYSYEIDVWAWGVVLCELIGGYNPFSSGTDSDVQMTYANILSLTVNWPKNIPFIIRQLLTRIFVREPLHRLTIKDIKAHSYFQGVDWYDLSFQF